MPPTLALRKPRNQKVFAARFAADSITVGRSLQILKLRLGNLVPKMGEAMRGVCALLRQTCKSLLLRSCQRHDFLPCLCWLQPGIAGCAGQRRDSTCGALADAATGTGCIAPTAEIQKLARLAKLQPVSPRP